MGAYAVLIAAVVLAAAALYRFILYPVLFSPLAKIPSAHWSCSFCPVWITWQRWSQQENRVVYDAHMKLGTAVRLGPSLLSINCFDDGIKTIYQGGFPKPDFYFNGFAVYGVGNLFTIKDNETHAARKKVIANVFGKSSVMSSESVRISTRDVLYEHVLPLLENAAAMKKPVEILDLTFCYFLDNFVQWQFGRSLRSNLVSDEKERRMYLDGFLGVAPYTFWQYNFPDLTSLLRKVGYIPKSVNAGFSNVEDWNLEKCDRAQQLLASGGALETADRPVVFEHALKGMSKVDAKPGEYPNRMELASDMFSLNSGAFETSGNTTTFIFYELCRNPEWQAKLRQELFSHAGDALAFCPGKVTDIEQFADPRGLDELPILHAIIMETMRLWPSVPGGQPRVVPRPCTIAGYHDIPTGTVVQAYASVLHRTPEVFPEPMAWRPQRWLDADASQLALMKRWSWGFGSGGRGCLGNHFAYYSMKYLIAHVYANFTTSIHDTGDMTPIDAYLSHPKGKSVEIRFHRLVDVEKTEL